MGEIRIVEIANCCPHCGSEGIVDDKIWEGVEYEGEDYFIYCYKCKDCGTFFAIKRMHNQFD